jgi:hypothetical protein
LALDEAAMHSDSDQDFSSRDNGLMDDQTRLEAIRKAVLAGEESGVADGDVMEEIRERMRRRALASSTPRMRNL